jgi:hypothetical protein
MATMLTLFFIAGAIVLIEAPNILKSQFKLFFLISLPLMLMQVVGISNWVQIFNTLYNIEDMYGNIIRPEFELMPLLFTSQSELIYTHYEEFYQYLSMQSRPPGLMHSSAMLSPFILFGAAIHLSNLNGNKIILSDYILMAVVVLSGSKLALLGYLIVSIQAYVLNNKIVRFRIIKMFTMLLLIIITYSILFPAPFAHNYGSEAFEVSFLARIADAVLDVSPDLMRFFVLAEILEKFPTLINRDQEIIGGLSGMAQLLKFSPLIFLILLFLVPWITRGVNRCKKLSSNVTRIPALMTTVIIIIPFATPLFKSPFYAFSVGLVCMPIMIGIFPRWHRHLSYIVKYKKINNFNFV